MWKRAVLLSLYSQDPNLLSVQRKREDGGGRHSSGTSGPSEALAGD